MDGILLINKPAGYTSHDVVAVMRRKLKTKRIGHAGTLDPLATGVLVLLVGSATKLSDQFIGFDKTYEATLKLGVKTVSADTMGAVIEEKPYVHLNQEDVRRVMATFLGDIMQMPPMVSAVKVNGERLYKLARQGKDVKREPRAVRIDQLDVLSINFPYVRFIMSCSKGTYVRQLAEDVGEALGCGACISQIERTKVGPFVINDAVSLEEANESHLRLFNSFV